MSNFPLFKKATKPGLIDVETTVSNSTVLPEEVKAEVSVENPQPNFTNTALSFFKDKETGLWTLVKVMFDPISKVAGSLEVVETAYSRSEIEEKFKITASRQIFVATLS